MHAAYLACGVPLQSWARGEGCYPLIFGCKFLKRDCAGVPRDARHAPIVRLLVMDKQGENNRVHNSPHSSLVNLLFLPLWCFTCVQQLHLQVTMLCHATLLLLLHSLCLPMVWLQVNGQTSVVFDAWPAACSQRSTGRSLCAGLMWLSTALPWGLTCVIRTRSRPATDSNSVTWHGMYGTACTQ